MKKFLLTLIAILVSTTAAFAIFDKHTINREALPAEAREMLEEHFPKSRVSMIKVDKHCSIKFTRYPFFSRISVISCPVI